VTTGGKPATTGAWSSRRRYGYYPRHFAHRNEPVAGCN
jgi:hypothetical protein